MMLKEYLEKKHYPYATFLSNDTLKALWQETQAEFQTIPPRIRLRFFRRLLQSVGNLVEEYSERYPWW